MNNEADIVTVQIPMFDGLYLYADEYHKAQLDNILSAFIVSHRFQFRPNDGYWVLELTGDEQNVSGAAYAASEFYGCLLSHLDEDVLELPGNADLDAFKRLADLRIAGPTHFLLLPTTSETGFRLVGPRVNLAQTRDRLLAMAVELGLPIRLEPCEKTEFTTTLGTRVSIIKGNLILQQVDAIVNPANECLRHDGGAARAIADAAGPLLNRECQEFIRDHGTLGVTEVTHTRSGRLCPRIKYVLHAVGPRSGRYPDPSDQRRLLEATFFNCLMYADSILNVSSIALPAIGSGIYGIPKGIMAEAAFSGLRQFETVQPQRKLLTIDFVNIDDSSTGALLEVFGRRLSLNPGTKPQAELPRSLGVKDSQSVHACPKDETAATKGCGLLEDGRGRDPFSASNVPCQRAADDLRARRTVQFHVDGEEAMALGDGGAEVTTSDQQDPHPVNASPIVSQENDNRVQDTEVVCVICLGAINSPKELPCGHRFCEKCINDSFEQCQPMCPSCGRLYGILRGNQPPGTMTISVISKCLPGYPRYETLVIDYKIPHGIQSDKHPNPGQPYYGDRRTAYLPNNREGREVCDLLRRAFDAGLIFTIGRSTTTGIDNQIVWNDVHHKTNVNGVHGYPDPGYLSRVKEELKAKGIVQASTPYNCNLL